MAEPRFEFRPVSAGNWADLEKLFEARGGPKSCWCMVWRAAGAEARRRDGKSRRAALRARVADGVPVGILGYLAACGLVLERAAPDLSAARRSRRLRRRS